MITRINVKIIDASSYGALLAYKISQPVAVNQDALYFFILHEGKIVNFLYNHTTDELKKYQYSGPPVMQMTCAFQNDLDGGPPFFPRYRAGANTYVNTLSQATIQSMEENEVFDHLLLKIRKPTDT